MKFCEKLQNLRKENNLSQEQLADMLDISRQSVSKWESGTTYPEMDKLIQLSKIFKCSLDDLTNDEIDVTLIKENKKGGMSNLVDTLTNLLNKIFKCLKNMRFRDYIRLLIELFILYLILKLSFEPCSYIERNLSEIFYNFGDKVGNILTDIFGFIIESAYVLFSVVVLLFVLKIRFIDRFSNNNTNSTIIKDEDNSVQDNNNSNTIISNHNRNHNILDTFVNIIIFFIKCIVVMLSIPLLFGILSICAALIISLILLFYKIVYIGVIILLIFSLVLSIFMLELIFDFIFSKKVNFKRIIITFIVGIVGLGFGVGLFLNDITNLTFIDEAPRQIKQTTEVKEIKMNNNYYIDNNLYYSNINYIENNNLNNVKIEYIYYKDFNDVYFNIDENNIVFISHENENIVAMKEYKEIIMNDLKKKEIYNYENLYKVIINVYASKSNIEKMKTNYNNHVEQTNQYLEQEENNKIEKKINALEEDNSKLLEENNELKESLEDQNNKLKEYRERIQELLEN